MILHPPLEELSMGERGCHLRPHLQAMFVLGEMTTLAAKLEREGRFPDPDRYHLAIAHW